MFKSGHESETVSETVFVFVVPSPTCNIRCSGAQCSRNSVEAGGMKQKKRGDSGHALGEVSGSFDWIKKQSAICGVAVS